MYRLLIVDDEEIIVNGLYEIFKSMADMDLDVYKAYSGQEAIGWLSKTRMDILLTDINMPGISGLQLVEFVQKSWPRCQVVFLTGHEKFSYIYEAIKHANVNYLLKTEDPEQVIKAVRLAVNQIQNEIQTEDLIQQSKQHIEKAQSLFQSDYLLRLLRNDSMQVDAGELERLGITLNPKLPVIMLLGQLVGIGELASYSERIEALNTFRLLVTRLLGIQVRYNYVLDDRHQYIWLMQPMGRQNGDQFGELYTFLSGTLESILAAVVDKMAMDANFAISLRPVSWDKLTEACSHLTERLDHRAGFEGEIILANTEEDASAARSLRQSPLREAEQDALALEAELRKRRPGQIKTMLDMGEQGKFFESIELLLTYLAQVRSKHSNIANEAYFFISMVFLGAINRWQAADKIAFRISLSGLTKPSQFGSWAAAVDYLRQIGAHLFQIRSQEDEDKMHSTINQLHYHVLGHLGDDLSLVRLADVVHLNPSYLSRLYKQMTGINLSDFIDSARFEHAKTLLGDQQLRISEVARQVGYESAASFSRFFKKAASCTPQEYRDQVKNRIQDQ